MAETNAAERERLDLARTRIVDTFVAGHIDAADRDRRPRSVSDALAALDAHEAIHRVAPLD